MKKQCLALLQNCRQEDNESLEDYRDRYVELLAMTDQKQSEYCWMFSDGIRRKNQRDAVITGCGETDLLTIDQAYEIARRVEMFGQLTRQNQNADQWGEDDGNDDDFS